MGKCTSNRSEVRVKGVRAYVWNDFDNIPCLQRFLSPGSDRHPGDAMRCRCDSRLIGRPRPGPMERRWTGKIWTSGCPGASRQCSG